LQPTKYERRLGKSGRAVINQKRRVTLPQVALIAAGLKDGDYVAARADGPGRIVLEKSGLPVWAEAS
jgi:bifunctional DNA-binding transcriptional regulator/antitoxin component of YhaV-PrlF toxin-antitoxin module